MYNVTQKFHQLAIQPSSKTRCRIYFIPDTVDCTDDNDVITNGTLLVRDNTDTDSGRRISGDTGVIFSNYFNTEKNIQLGCCVSNQVEMHLLNLDGALTNFTFGRCKIFLDVYNADNSTWLNCPMGVYILEQPVNSDQNVITVHGFDQMQLLDAPAETWWNTIDWSTGRVSLYTLLTGICTAVGVPWSMIIEGDRNIKFMKYPYTPMDISTKSFRDVLKQIAESTGSMAYFTRNGELDLRWFSYAKVTGYATYTGQTISIVNGISKTVDSLTVPITPTQNLNGYSKPWAGGAGKNLLQVTGRTAVTTGNILNTTPRDFSAPYAYIGITMNNYFNNGKISSYSITDKSVSLTSKQKGYGIGLNVGVSPETTYTFSYKNKTSSFAGVGYYDIDGNYLSYKQFAGEWSFTTPANCVNLMVVLLPNANIDTLYDEPQLELGSLESSWVPYENICPISGSTGLSVYVSPTQDQQDATTYAEDWTSQAGTVYAGSIDVVAGTLKARPRYASYNGETLVGPWMSSMDEYAAGTSPTTGAEVVDLGGSETTYQLTPTKISLLTTVQNYLWASNGETLTVVTGGRTELTIDTDQVGNQCLSIGIANYNVEKFGRIETRLGTSKLAQTKTSAEYPNPKNQYLIDGNAFLNPNAPPLYDIDVSPTYEYIYVILERLWNLTPYTPIQTKLVWDWSIDAGDIIQVKRNNVTYVFPIFQVAMTWRGGYVVADVMNDGDVVKPYTDSQNEQTKDAISQFIVNGGAGTVSTDLTFVPGESALIVISGAAGVRTAAFIVYCDADGKILKRDISSGSAYSYVTSTPYTVTIKNSSHNNNSGLKISF